MKQIIERALFWMYPRILGLRHRHALAYRLCAPLAIQTPIERMLDCAMDFAYATQVSGDYFEFGSYEGHSASIAYHLSRRYGPPYGMRFYCFDSFQGLPEIRTDNKHEKALFKRGDLACDERVFVENLKRRLVDMQYVTVVPGWYADTLTEETKRRLPAKKAAIVLIDCDLHSSTVSALDFITDYVVDGTVVIFDDWFLFRGNPRQGEQRAFAEWLARNPQITATEYRKSGWHINSFILHHSEKNG